MELIKTQKIYQGRIFDLAHHVTKLPNGKETQYDVIEHNGAAVIIPVTDSGELVMVRQYRPGSGTVMLELPAGKLEGPDEDPQECALRELAEETGFRAKKIRPLLKLHPLAAYCTEQIFMFLAENLIPGETNLDEGEFIDIEIHPLPAVLDMIDNNKISDMKTIAGVLYYDRIRTNPY